MNESGVVGLYVHMGQLVEKAIADHEDRLHIPPRERGPLQAIPFAQLQINDLDAARAVELLETGASIYEAAAAIDAPSLALERKLADWWPRWRRFLHERETAV